jgi:putative oxidoreductase
MSMSKRDLGMLLLRLVVGAVFIVQGWTKIQGMEATLGFFASLGLNSFWAHLVAWAELVAGIAMFVGIFTRLAAYLITIIMIVAVYMVTFKMGFLMGYSTNLLLIAGALAVGWNNAGVMSVAGAVCGCGKCMMCGGSMMKKA